MPPQQDKTEEPTPRRREELRQKGKVPISVDFTSGFSFIVLFLLATFIFPSLSREMMSLIEEIWAGNYYSREVDSQWVFHLAQIGVGYFARGVLPFVVVAAGLALFLGFLQTGFVISGEKLKPNFDYVNPVRGLERLFSLRLLVEALKISIKVFLGIVLAYVVVKDALPRLTDLIYMELLAGIETVEEIAERLGLYLGGLFLGVGFFDFFYQRFEYERNIKMTKEELKEEYRRTEGDPIIKSHIRRRQREIARRRMMQEIPKAQVVVTNPTHIACALRYERGKMRAPVLVAKGQRLIAEKIKKIAQENGVPIVENKKVAWELYKSCEIGQEIPSFLYRAVAEILAFVYRLKATYGGRRNE
ncbi:MAG TPA: flagellar biosynthesis protein FlhB [Candidatus Atribacteria bacterium]|nr:flagellar biosynthesis protein FlhB [Candidatus Atribacteria bacterium]